MQRFRASSLGSMRRLGTRAFGRVEGRGARLAYSVCDMTADTLRRTGTRGRVMLRFFWRLLLHGRQQ